MNTNIIIYIFVTEPTKIIVYRLELQITHEGTLSSNLGNLLKKTHPSLME